MFILDVILLVFLYMSLPAQPPRAPSNSRSRSLFCRIPRVISPRSYLRLDATCLCDTASGHVPLAARPQTHLSLPAADSTGRRWLSVYGTLIYGTLSLFYSTWPSLRLHQVSNSISISIPALKLYSSTRAKSPHSCAVVSLYRSFDGTRAGQGLLCRSRSGPSI